MFHISSKCFTCLYWRFTSSNYSIYLQYVSHVFKLFCMSSKRLTFPNGVRHMSSQNRFQALDDAEDEEQEVRQVGDSIIWGQRSSEPATLPVVKNSALRVDDVADATEDICDGDDNDTLLSCRYQRDTQGEIGGAPGEISPACSSI